MISTLGLGTVDLSAGMMNSMVTLQNIMYISTSQVLVSDKCAEGSKYEKKVN